MVLNNQEPYSLIGWRLLVFPRYLGFKSPLPIVTIKLQKNKIKTNGVKLLNAYHIISFFIHDNLKRMPA